MLTTKTPRLILAEIPALRHVSLGEVKSTPMALYQELFLTYKTPSSVPSFLALINFTDLKKLANTNPIILPKNTVMPTLNKRLPSKDLVCL